MSASDRQYRLPDDLDDLLKLEPPERTSLATATEDDLLSVAKNFRSLWLAALSAKPLLQINDVRLEPEQFARLMLTVGGTYDYAIHRLLAIETSDVRQNLGGMSIPMIDTLTERADEIFSEDVEDDPHLTIAKATQLSSLHLAHDYGLYLIAAEVLSIPVMWALGPTSTYKLDHQLVASLARLAKQGPSPSANIDQLASRFLRSGLDHAVRIAADRESSVNADHKPGSYSWLRHRDLGPIAARSKSMIRRHGEKALEAVFEQEIALVFQSLGFLVIPTHPGKRSVDLLCLSNDQPENRMIMVEAKTTKGFYSLPARDSRALREYVESVRRSLRTLPDPCMLLVIAPKPASTLDKKLEVLSEAVRLPMRFLRAETLAALREDVLGAIPSDLLIDGLMNEPTTITDEFPQKVADRIRELQQAHRRLAKDLETVWSQSP